MFERARAFVRPDGGRGRRRGRRRAAIIAAAVAVTGGAVVAPAGGPVAAAGGGGSGGGGEPTGAEEIAAGPVIIDGTDAGLHGSIQLDGSGVPKASEMRNSWIYWLKAWEAVLADVPESYDHNGKVAVVGASQSTNTNNNCGAVAHYSSERLATGPIDVDYFDGVEAIEDFFAGVLAGTHRYKMVNIVEEYYCGNGMSAAEAAVVDANGPAIAAHVNRGGGLFSLTQSYGWLQDLFPEITTRTDWKHGWSGNCSGFGSQPQLTPEGYAQFPGLNNSDLQAPWHTCFRLDEGAEWPLQVLARELNNDEVVILGGSSVALPSNVALTVAPSQPRPGEEVCATATVTEGGSPVSGANVDFTVSGASGAPGATVPTDGDGLAEYCYSSAGSGLETVTATVASGPGSGSTSSAFTWSRISLTADPGTLRQRGEEVCITATVADLDPESESLVPTEGENVSFTVSGANPVEGASVVSGADGTAEFCYTGTVSGTDTVAASVGVGPASDTRKIVVTYAGPQLNVPAVDHPHGQSGKVVPIGLVEFDAATDLWVEIEVPAGNGTLSVDVTGLTLSLVDGSPSFSGQTHIAFTGSRADVAAALASRVTWSAPGDPGVSTFAVTVRDAPSESDATLLAARTVQTMATAAPSIDTQPADVTAAAGSVATFGVGASGFPAPSVRWQVNTGSGWTDVPGATSATHEFTATSDQDGHTFRAVVTNSQGTVTSDPVTVTVTEPVEQTITFEQPADRRVDEGPFDVVATATSELPVSFSAAPDWVCTVAGSTVTPVGVGSCTITATQSGDSVHAAAPPVERTFEVLAAAEPKPDPKPEPKPDPKPEPKPDPKPEPEPDPKPEPEPVFGGTGETKLAVAIDLKLGSKVAGSDVVVSGSGLKPSSPYRIEMHSEPVLLGTGTTDAEGAFTTTVRLPAEVPTGAHRIIAIGESPTGEPVVAEQGFFVDSLGRAGGVSRENGFEAVAPTRVEDTRAGAALVAGERHVIDLTGSVPSGASAVALNVTVTRAASAGYLTVFPCGIDVPDTSNVNFAPGQDVANMVTVPLEADALVCVVSNAAADVVVDMNGHFGGWSDHGFEGLRPVRVLDTRVGGERLGAGATTPVRVTGSGLAPVGADAVVVTLTATEPLAAGYVTVFPCGGEVPEASNLNFGDGQTVANQAIVQVGSDGEVCVHSSADAHVLVDLAGSFHDGTSRSGGVTNGELLAVAPFRMLDTRTSGAPHGAAAGSITRIDLVDAVAPADTVAVALNVTVTQPAAAGYATVYPCGGDVPYASNVNFVPGQSVGNHVTVDVGEGGAVCVYTDADLHLVVDLIGLYRADAA